MARARQNWQPAAEWKRWAQSRKAGGRWQLELRSPQPCALDMDMGDLKGKAQSKRQCESAWRQSKAGKREQRMLARD